MKGLREVTDETFDDMVLKADKPLLLEFMSPTCRSCKAIAGRLEELAEEFQGKAEFLQLSIADNMRWEDYDIRNTPTLLYFANGEEMERQDFFPSREEIKEQLNKLTS